MLKTAVLQIGARMDYAVARALHSSGDLACLVTDLHFDSVPALNALKRYHSAIPSDLVSKDIFLGALYRLQLRLSKDRAWPHLRVVESLADRAVESIEKTDATAIYGFDTALLPIMMRLQGAPVMRVMEQCIAPRKQLIKSLLSVQSKLNHYGITPEKSRLSQILAYSSVFGSLESKEWEHADLVYCASNFVAKSLAGQGVSEDRIRIVPYGVTVADELFTKSNHSNAKPIVAFAGAFSFRKGALEFGRLAHSFKSVARFQAYGSVQLSQEMINQLAPDVTFLGHLSRRDLYTHLANASIFVLPSYSEGSATVIYEAMALGVPCVVTAQSGSVITNGEDGFIVPAGDDAALAEAVGNLLDNTDLRNRMGRAASETARRYTRESYGARVSSQIKLDYENYINEQVC